MRWMHPQRPQPRSCRRRAHSGPSRDHVAGVPISQALNCRVKARRAPSARSVVGPRDQIHDVGLAVEQPEQTHPKHDARVGRWDLPCRMHGTQRRGTHTASSGGGATLLAAPFRLHSAARSGVRGRAADPHVCRAGKRCTSGPSPPKLATREAEFSCASGDRTN